MTNNGAASGSAQADTDLDAAVIEGSGDMPRVAHGGPPASGTYADAVVLKADVPTSRVHGRAASEGLPVTDAAPDDRPTRLTTARDLPEKEGV